MSRSLDRRHRLLGPTGLVGVVCLLLQACSQAPRAPAVSTAEPEPELASQPAPTPPPLVDATPAPAHPTSTARTPGEYRLHAARHVYDQHAAQLFSGPLPPLLQAVGVLNLEIGARGEVRSLNWLRAPTHAPEVMRQIEHLVHRAAPYPAPLHLHSVTYTDTWLWHHSGRFQLHTLSEGQLGESAVSNAEGSKRRASTSPAPTRGSVQSAKCKPASLNPGQGSAYC